MLIWENCVEYMSGFGGVFFTHNFSFGCSFYSLFLSELVLRHNFKYNFDTVK